MNTRRNSARARRSTMVDLSGLFSMPKELLVKIVREYLTIVEWSRLDIALCTHHDIRRVYLDALKTEIITLSVKNDMFWNSILKKGVLKWIVANKICIVSWANKRYSCLNNMRLSVLSSAVSLKTCKVLDICGTLITESTLASVLKRLPNLEEVHIGSCFNILNAGIKTAVSMLPKLTLLNIRKCLHVTDDGLAVLTDKLPNLTTLCISCCAKITEVGLVDVATRLTSIKSLDISGIKVTDAGVSKIINGFGPNSTLQSLFLAHNNEITDKAVIEIVNGLPNLQLLDISACGRTTDKVIEDIRTRVPTLRLIR